MTLDAAVSAALVLRENGASHVRITSGGVEATFTDLVKEEAPMDTLDPSLDDPDKILFYSSES